MRFCYCSCLTAVALLSCGLLCEDVPTSPDLYRVPSGHDYYVFDPVMSADGHQAYYLASDIYWEGGAGAWGLRGSLWVMNLSDTTDRLLLEGSFHRLAISRDGRRLAVYAPDSSGPDSVMFVVVDTAVTETLAISVSTKGIPPTDLAFFADDRELVFNACGEDSTWFYAVGLEAGDTVRLVASAPWRQFGVLLTGRNTLWLNSRASDEVAVFPPDPRWMLYADVPRNSPSRTWRLYDRDKDRDDVWGRDLEPDAAWYGMPNWSPNGQRFVFVASTRGGPSGRMELWLVVNAAGHVP